MYLILTYRYEVFRQNCTNYLKENPVQLGGPGKIVEVDESCVAGKMKYNRGQTKGKQVWVIGCK